MKKLFIILIFLTINISVFSQGYRAIPQTVPHINSQFGNYLVNHTLVYCIDSTMTYEILSAATPTQSLSTVPHKLASGANTFISTHCYSPFNTDSIKSCSNKLILFGDTIITVTNGGVIIKQY
jgi:hypothetical protein